jgi:hypothetical protein
MTRRRKQDARRKKILEKRGFTKPKPSQFDRMNSNQQKLTRSMRRAGALRNMFHWETLFETKGKVEVTVGLPMYHQSKIGWLVMEGLANQTHVNIGWELLIIEEIENAFGMRNVMKYIPRLKKAGCVRIRYMPLSKWIPLGQKWWLMGRDTAQSSKCFLLQGSDSYPQPKRIRETYDIFIKESPAWCHSREGYVLDIPTGTLAKFNCNKWKWFTCLNIAVGSEYMRKLPMVPFPRRFVDGWLFRNVKKLSRNRWRVSINQSPSWSRGLGTNGYNTLSKGRLRHMQAAKPPYVKTDIDVKEIVPSDVAKRLIAMKK